MANAAETQQDQATPHIVRQPKTFLDQRGSVYAPLDESSRSIRLLDIQPGSWRDPIVGNLSVHSLDDPDCPAYDALSYVWGDLNDCREITLNGVAFRVTISQYTALRRLRRLPDTNAASISRAKADRGGDGGYAEEEEEQDEEENRRVTPLKMLWIDATCVDQNNSSERSHQVGFMGDIYRQAENVFVWLGELCVGFDRIYAQKGEDLSPPPNLYHEQAPKICPSGDKCGVQQAVEIWRLLGTKDDFGALPIKGWEDESKSFKYPTIDRRWQVAYNTFTALLEHAWWGRVWTLQEATLAKLSPLLLVGPHCFHLRLIGKAAGERQEHSWHCCGALALLTSSTPWVNVERAHFLRQMYRKHGYCSLSKLATAVQLRRASDERDKIYAVRDLLQRRDFSVDYGRSVALTFAIATRQIFVEQGDLRDLSVRKLRTDSGGHHLPSWVRDFSSPEDKSRMDNGWNGFRSAGHMDLAPPSSIAEEQQGKTSLKLRVSVHRLAQVKEIGSVLATRLINSADRGSRYNFLELARFIDEVKIWQESRATHTANSTVDVDLEMQRLWRCLFQDTWAHRVANRQLACSLDAKEIEGIVFEKTGFEIIASCLPQVSECLANGQGANADTVGVPYDVVYHILGMLDLLYFNCGVVVYTSDRGQLGIGWENVREGDEIYLVKGSPKPLILRRVGNRDDDDGSRPQMTFTGSCYIDGIMQGEAVTDETTWMDVDLV